jgi:hypothetical protein
MGSRALRLCAALVLVAALGAGCGTAPESEREPASANSICDIDRDEDAEDKASDAHLTEEEVKLAKAAGKEFGEDPDLYVMVVETIMGLNGVSVEEAMHRAAIQYRSDGADGAVRAAARDAFGGIWLDDENGGKYTVAVTREEAVPAVEAVLEEHGLLEDSAVVLVEATEKELERAQTVLEDLVFDDPGGLSLGSDPTRGCVMVEVDSFFPEARIDEIEKKAAELGVGVHVERVDQTDGDPEATGVIERIDPKDGVLMQPEADCGVWLSGDENTQVFDVSGADASWADLAPGMTIDVWFDGPIAASCPALGGAAKVVIKGG